MAACRILPIRLLLLVAMMKPLHHNQYTMRKLFLFLIGLVPVASFAQVGFGTFESLPLPTADTYYVNYSMPGKDVGFNEASVHYPCVYDTLFGGLWVSGFAYSNKRDSVTSGFRNQYAAKPLLGHDGSLKYVVVNGAVNGIKTAANIRSFAQLSIANTTYAYNSMRDGDAFAKKFGGSSGNDPDWFKVTIRGFYNNVRVPDSIDVYLADFRSANNTNDFILNSWKDVALPFPPFATDSITFTLTSSDTGAFGMNTPAYFCIDDVHLYAEGVEQVPFVNLASIFPNPTSNFLHLDIKDASVKEAMITDITGRLIANISIKSSRVDINISTLPSGQYILKIVNKEHTAVTKFIKQ